MQNIQTDLYRAKAAELFDTGYKEVTKLQRQFAKKYMFIKLYSRPPGTLPFPNSWRT